MLENQCSLWPDPISAVVYVPTLKGKIFSDDISLNGSHLGVALERLADFHQRMELSGWPAAEAWGSKTSCSDVLATLPCMLSNSIAAAKAYPRATGHSRLGQG